MIVLQKFSADPSAIFEIDERSSGSSIKLYESMSNVPILPGRCEKSRGRAHFRLMPSWKNQI